MFNLLDVRFQYMASRPTIEGLFQNSVSIIYIHNYYIIVASTGCHGEFPHLLYVYIVGFVHCIHKELCFSIMLFLDWICDNILVSNFLVGLC